MGVSVASDFKASEALVLTSKLPGKPVYHNLGYLLPLIPLKLYIFMGKLAFQVGSK